MKGRLFPVSSAHRPVVLLLSSCRRHAIKNRESHSADLRAGKEGKAMGGGNCGTDLKILMLGNSLTSANNMPLMLAKLLGAEVTVHARGGARLAEQLNPNTKMGARTALALHEQHFDYVILQEMSHGPATATDRYLDSVRKLTKIIREAGAEPVLYASWAFRPDCLKLQSIGMDAPDMHQRMQEAFRAAALENDLAVANVGETFERQGFAGRLYAADGLHPSEEGSRLAAGIIAAAVRDTARDAGGTKSGSKFK